MTLLDLGPYIREERKRAGLSMQALAEMAGVDRTTLSKLENQRLPEMGYAKLERLLAALNLEFSVRPIGGLPTLKDLQRERAGGDE
ncbi:MAG: helix-turn-helix transcriptional regulator [Marinobacter sp.]|uniref:helix-turn-helix domain-containing protein n=1 Tax=Marinobacter sp. TaxID=50741 RepID=UPI0032995293